MALLTVPRSQDIRSGIRAVLEEVVGIGPVHDRFRDTQGRPDLLRELFTEPATGRLHAWQFRRTSFRERETDAGVEFPSLETYEIQGFLAVSDATDTETEFQDLVDRIRDAFRGESSRVFIVHPESDLDSEQAVSEGRIDHGKFGSVEVHVATLTLQVRQRHCLIEE